MYITASVLMSDLPKPKAKRQPLASLLHTCGVSFVAGMLVVSDTIVITHGLSGAPQSSGIDKTSKL